MGFATVLSFSCLPPHIPNAAPLPFLFSPLPALSNRHQTFLSHFRIADTLRSAAPKFFQCCSSITGWQSVNSGSFSHSLSLLLAIGADIGAKRPALCSSFAFLLRIKLPAALRLNPRLPRLHGSATIAARRRGGRRSTTGRYLLSLLHCPTGGAAGNRCRGCHAKDEANGIVNPG